MQGWRIEIKAFPKLTEFGSWRGRDPDSMYGGFYTQEQVRVRHHSSTHRLPLGQPFWQQARPLSYMQGAHWPSASLPGTGLPAFWVSCAKQASTHVCLSPMKGLRWWLRLMLVLMLCRSKM